MPSYPALLAALATVSSVDPTPPSEVVVPKWCHRKTIPLCDDAAAAATTAATAAATTAAATAATATGSSHLRQLRVSSYPTNKGHFCSAARAWLASERGARWDGAAFFEGRPRCPRDAACGSGSGADTVAIFFQDEHALVRQGANFSCSSTCVSAVGSAEGGLDAEGRPYNVRVVQGGKYDSYDVIADYRCPRAGAGGRWVGMGWGMVDLCADAVGRCGAATGYSTRSSPPSHWVTRQRNSELTIRTPQMPFMLFLPSAQNVEHMRQAMGPTIMSKVVYVPALQWPYTPENPARAVAVRDIDVLASGHWQVEGTRRFEMLRRMRAAGLRVVEVHGLPPDSRSLRDVLDRTKVLLNVHQVSLSPTMPVPMLVWDYQQLVVCACSRLPFSTGAFVQLDSQWPALIPMSAPLAHWTQTPPNHPLATQRAISSHRRPTRTTPSRNFECCPPCSGAPS